MPDGGSPLLHIGGTEPARNILSIALIGWVAFAVRLAAVLALGSFRLDHVSYEHGQIARNMVEGRGFTIRWMGAEGPTSQQAPVYPTLVAGFYWLFGPETPAAHRAIQVVQCLFGAIMAMGVVGLAKELLPRLAHLGWLAGLGAAIYPTLVYSATQIQVASLATMLVVLVMWLAVRSARTNSMTLAACCGVTGGLVVLTDPILTLAVLVALGCICRFCAGHKVWGYPMPVGQKHWGYQAALVLGIAASITVPLILRNYHVHGELVFVKSTFGYAFWQGNHPRSFGTDKIPLLRAASVPGPAPLSIRALEQSLWKTRLVDTLYIDDAVLSNERIAELGLLSEPERSRALKREAMEFIRADPRHYFRLCLQRLRFFLLFDETNPKAQVRVYRLSHLGLQVAACLGLWLTRRDWRALWPTYMLFAGITLFHMVTIVSARFHIPLEPIQILWGGAGLAELSSRLGSYMAGGVVPRLGLLRSHASAGAN